MLAVKMQLWKRILVMLLSLLGCWDIFQNKTKGQGNRCDGGNGCCAGYTWNEQLKTCEKCDLGYYGIDCDKPCLYPYYGENCDGECSCSEGRCNISYGCMSSNDTYTYSTVFSESHNNGTTSASVELSSSPKDKQKHGHFYQIPQQRFNIIISLICVGVFILVVVVISVGCVLHKRALRRFNPASSCDTNINSIGLVCKHENGDKVFGGDAKLGIFYNKERKTYHVEICTDQRIVSSDNQYLTTDETRPVEEPAKVYESLEEDFKLSLGTIRPNVKSNVPDSSETSSGSESECDTTVKEVARSTNTDQSRKETDKNIYLTVY